MEPEKQKVEKIPEFKFRTCSEICIDADNHKDDLQYLSKLFKEMIANGTKYALVELDFISEHLINYAKSLGQNDAKKMKQFMVDAGLDLW